MIALLLVAQLSATGVTAPPAPAIAPTASTKPEDAQVCRTDVTTGHRIASYVCHTRAEWRRIENGTRDALDRQESRSQANCLRGVTC